MSSESDKLSDEEFLVFMEVMSESQLHVTRGQVDRLRKLACWADTIIPPSWTGTIDPGETKRAVANARKILKSEA